MFMQIRIFLHLIQKMEFKRKFASSIKGYNEYYTLNILYWEFLILIAKIMV